jgi:hypothetical protein
MIHFGQGIVDPELDPGARWCSKGPKNQSAQNLFKINVCIGVGNMNPTQLEWAQMDVLCSTY